MNYFKNLIEKSEKNYIFETLGKRPLDIHNMRKIKILPFQCGSHSPAFRKVFLRISLGKPIPSLSQMTIHPSHL
jgi:hypothetical protein